MPPPHLQLRLPILALLGMALLPGSLAQDTRSVAEPRLPASCIELKAHLAAPQGKLSDADEQQEDTVRIQQALDRCAPGKAVRLRSSSSHHIFLSGPLQLPPAVTLVVDGGTALYGSRNPRDYDLTPGSCGIVSERGHGCKPLLLAKDAAGAGVMGGGVIDGRGGAFLLGQKQTWWDLAHQAKIEDLNQSCPRLLVIQHSDNFTLYRITLRNSPNFHVSVEQTDGFTAWGVHIDTPATARNTDGIDPSSSKNVTIAHSYIRAGDDDVAIKAGKLGPSSHMTISDNHFYSGHGMSIGSETNGGVSDIEVRNLTIDGADNGIRIKSDLSRGGLVQRITYEDVCMRDVKNPIVMTPHYSNKQGDLVPEYRDILLRNVNVLTPGRYTLEGQDEQHKLSVRFDNVWIDGGFSSKDQAANAEFILGPQLGNLIPQGPNVTAEKTADSRSGKAPYCEGRFQPYPVSKVQQSAGIIPAKDTALYVAADGKGEYTTVQGAVDAAPNTGTTIHIAPGTYREAVVIDKPDIRLIGGGSSSSDTVIVFDKSAGTSGGTLNSATVAVRAPDFFVEHLTIANDWNRTHLQGSQGSQALAVLVTGDKDIFNDVRLLGNQDTLYAGSQGCVNGDTSCTPARQFFSNCYIEGNVDFIFGDGKAYFRDCEIRSTPHRGGYVTAQSKHYPQEESAFVFDHCRFTADAGAGEVWLGRPWRPYATVVFLHAWMDSHIVPAGWREWHPGETHSLDTAWYGEFDSQGPGATMKDRDPHTHLLNADEAQRFTLSKFFPDWNPEAALKAATSR